MKCRSAVIKVVLATASALCLAWAAAMLYVLFSKKAEAVAVTPVVDSRPLTEMEIPHRRVFIADVRRGDTLRVPYILVNAGLDSLFLGRINPDCTCTDYVIDSKSAAPML